MKCVYLMFFLAFQLQLFIVFPHIGAEERIINGEMAQPNQFPWMAVIYRQQIKNDKYPVEVDPKSQFGPACGGSIVSEKVILTAAHCVFYYLKRIALVKYEAASFLVGIGENDINYLRDNLRYVQNVIVHPGYNTSTYLNDVALLVLTDKIDLKQDGVATIGICEKDIGEGVSVTAAGWGDTCQPSINRLHLRYAVMRTIPTKRCFNLTNNIDPTSMICAGPDTHIGNGDSGGGLWMTKDQTKSLIGIVSTGLGCEGNAQPQSFARLSKYRKWVEKIINEAR